MSSPDPEDEQPEEPVRLGPSRADLASLLVLAPFVGMGIGLALPWLATLAEDLPWVPFQGPLALASSIPGAWATAVGCIAGAVFGAGLAVVTIRDALRVTVASDVVSFERHGVTRPYVHSEVSAVFLDGKRLVVVDGASREVLCDELDATPEQIENAFRRHGYPWREDDPYAEFFQRWVPGTPELPSTVNAVFAARETSLRNKDGKDVDDLRSELLEKGFVVRDRKARQYWRSLR
ncbi:YqeB family protein [Rhodococcus sp. DT1]